MCMVELNHCLLFPELRNLGVVEAELHQDLPRVLAQPRGALANAASAAAVRPDRKLCMSPFGGFALDELWMLHRLARRDAQVDRYIALVAQTQPFGRRL